MNNSNLTNIRFIDLFAGIGGMRIGLENACQKMNIHSQCVLTSEIKPHAVETYTSNFEDSKISGDITQIDTHKISDFDILLAGFPCQPFSSAGNRLGFLDTRGTLFFEIERVLKEKNPIGFILENVEGLVRDKKGETLNTIIYKLESLGYKVTWKVLDSLDFGIPQSRKRIYIVGNKYKPIDLCFPQSPHDNLISILEQGKQTLDTEFTRLLLKYFSVNELSGKAIRDKRGGSDNIHSWDIEMKGTVSTKQKELLNLLLKQRRRKIWSEKKGITWMDGIPLTIDDIYTFYPDSNLESMLKDLVRKRYLKYEHPKDLVEVINKDGQKITKREYRKDLPKGYNIVVGKLSFEINKILDSYDVAPTLVATDMHKLAVIDGEGIRNLTIRECLRLFGFPENYIIKQPINKAYDLLGNTVAVPVIEKICEKIISNILTHSLAQSLSFTKAVQCV